MATSQKKHGLKPSPLYKGKTAGKSTIKSIDLAVPVSNDVLTPSEAAIFLRVAVDVVATEAEAGRLPGRKLATEWRFSKAALAEWLKGDRTAEFGVVTRPLRAVLGSVSDETPEEFEAFMATIRAQRDEVDRATGSGKYAAE